MAQPKDIPDEYVELTGEILALRTKMEIVRQENEALKDKIQVQLQANDKQRSALAEQIDANVRATKELAIEEQTQSDLDKKLAVKEGILLKIKTDKCDLANDRNREKKHLMNTMNMGLNVLELGDEMAEIEFVIGDHQILTTFNCKEEKFTLIEIKPDMDTQTVDALKQLLDRTNDISGLLSSVKSHLQA